ncbi:MAG: hypothetical protein ACK4G1_05820, partial [Ignavibacteria bacterium]
NIFFIYTCRDNLSLILPYLKNPSKFKNWIFCFVIPVIVVGITSLLISQIGNIKYKRPEFLIEFGLSSVFDIPIYYLWNLPLLFSTLVLIILMIEKITFLKSFLFTFLFTIAFLSLGVENFTAKFQVQNFEFLLPVFGLVFYNLGVLKFFRSIWISIFSIMTSIYAYVLIFGSKNSFLIKTFFARTYSQWDGIFIVRKISIETIDLIFTFLIILFGLFFFIFDRRKTK